MARRETAQIIIQIRGGLKAAAEAEAVAKGLDDVGDQATDAGRAAAIASGAFALLDRELRQVGIAAFGASIAMGAMTGAMLLTKVAALSLATLALPAVAIALWNVTLAAGIWTAALLGGMVAVLAGAGLMAAGVVGRFKMMSTIAGSAAADLKDTALSLKDSFIDAAAAGSDRLMAGLADGLRALLPLIESLRDVFTDLGTAFGSMFRGLGRTLAGLGPQIKGMLAEVPAAVSAVGDTLGAFIGLLVRLGTVGTPIFVDALKTISGWFRSFSDSIDGGSLQSALGTLRSFAAGFKSFASGVAEPLEGIFGAGMSEFGSALRSAARPIGVLVGTLLAGLIQVGRVVLPVVTRGVELLAGAFSGKVGPALQGIDVEKIGDALVSVVEAVAKALPGIVRGVAGVVGDIIAALKPAMPFVENVIWPLVKGIGMGLLGVIKGILPIVALLAQGLGWLGEKAEPLRGVFQFVGQAIGIIFSGAILKVIGLAVRLAGTAGRLGGVFRTVGGVIGRIGGAITGVGNIIGGVLGRIGGTLGRVAAAIGRHLGGIVLAVAGMPGKIANAAAGMFDGITGAFRSAINWIIRAWNGLEFGIPGFDPPGPGPKFPGITVGTPNIPQLANGGVIGAAGLAWVGERGRELMALPTAATVIPHGPSEALARAAGSSPAAAPRGGPLPDLVLHLHTNMDGREVAKRVDRVRLDELGRES